MSKMTRIEWVKIIRVIFRENAENTGSYFCEYDVPIEDQPNFNFDGEVPVDVLVDVIFLENEKCKERRDNLERKE